MEVIMKVSDVITYIDELKENKFTNPNKLRWVNDVDARVWADIYKYTDFKEVATVIGQAAYSIPDSVDFSRVEAVFVNGVKIHKIDHSALNTTGYYRGADGKINIYPVPTTAGQTIRIAYSLPFTEHASVNDDVLVSAPYSKIYWQYISAQIDWFKDDIDKYNNSIGLFNASMKEYALWWIEKNK
jgi:hypothetical protein